MRSQSEGFQASSRFRLTAPRLLLDDCDAWTLNASLRRLSSYRKCSKRRILGHSAQATSLLRIGRHDEMLAHSPWFRLWQRYGICSRPEHPKLRLGDIEG